MFSDMLMIWSDQPGTSLAIWLVVMITVLYLARVPAHQMIKTTGRTIYRFMRTSARAIAHVEQQAIKRNKEVTLALGQEATEKTIEREFSRVNDIVAKDLSHYPALHRQIMDAIETLEKDYQAATDAAPMPPEWLSVVETISALPKQSDPMVSNILENIKEEVISAHEETLKAYQKSSSERHRLLSAMQPQWRGLTGLMEKAKGAVEISHERAESIDQQMATYEAIRDQDDKVARALTVSSMTQFFIAGMVLCVAVMGGLINFQLIAVPMSEMVGGTSYVGSLKTSDIAALVIILVEIAMGLFLLESLRITRLFPVIGHMDDKMRRRMMVVTFSILFILASIEASLAYMRDLLALDREALQQSLTGVGTGVVEAQFRWIPSIGQMVMGFILPFALAFVAIPLESFIHAVRTVVGVAMVAVLRTLIISLRLVGGFANHSSKMLVHLYDMLIMVPLTIENWVRDGLAARTRSTETEVYDEVEEPVLMTEKMDETVEEAAVPKVASRRKKTTTTRKKRTEPVIDDDLAAQEI
ncbi:hypothetical protein [Gynuella sp.]|uniref:hypothetical protein n=1 Tax=Gynuella sp. TaxID=2969146 RepID=UPI003D135B39